MEYAKRGIRMNAAAPGIVDTPMHKDQMLHRITLVALHKLGGYMELKRQRRMGNGGHSWPRRMGR
jgi:NAD(P)-dependent dehydrogenase (short-subunit alcohol dehydrogenase family)